MADLVEKARTLIRDYQARGWLIATAESCTGGLVAGAITDISGSAAVFDRGFVTYSNEAKTDMLGVPPALIEAHGAVSREVAEAMAKGALARSRADVAVAITGIAGPTGGTKDKPVGLVWFGVAARAGKTFCVEWKFGGDRAAIRQAAVDQALSYFMKELV